MPLGPWAMGLEHVTVRRCSSWKLNSSMDSYGSLAQSYFIAHFDKQQCICIIWMFAVGVEMSRCQQPALTLRSEVQATLLCPAIAL